MISEAAAWNLLEGILLALIATGAMAEAKSSSLVPKSLLLWPALVMVLGIVILIQGGLPGLFNFFYFPAVLGILLILCGIQALLVNMRKLQPWPSGGIWFGLTLVGAGFQFHPLFLHHVIGFLWTAVGVTKVVRERSASLEGGTPLWILLLYAQAVLVASYR